MTIGELFVKLGVKGDDKTKKALKDTKSGLEEVASSGLAAKAAIVGLFYGLERLMANSSERGMALQQFANYTGLSTDKLQQWEVAARASGVQADEMESNIKGVQSAMTNLRLGHAPEFMNMLAARVGFDPSQSKKTFYVLDKLREYAKATANTPDIANKVLGSFGLSEGMIQFLRTSNVDIDKIKKSAILSGGEIGNLAKVSKGWDEIGKSLSLAFAKFNAKEGLSVVNSISKLATATLKLAEALTLLEEKLGVIAKLGDVAGVVADSIGGVAGSHNKADSKLGGIKGAGAYLYHHSGLIPGLLPPVRLANKVISMMQSHNQTVNIHGVKDAQHATHEFKKVIKDTYHQGGKNLQSN